MTKVRDALRVFRCWKCKTERIYSSAEAACLVRPSWCECGGFFALHSLQASVSPPEGTKP